ncbi:hypothetical protein Q8A73_012626 [Channa argus]|nr:hypothetical protein Q8A73_012626 [Channa argus]
MSVNSSTNSSLHPAGESCFYSRTNIFVFTALLITDILFLLPLFILVLFVGYKRWRKQCSGSPAAMNSHSDIFTHNMVTVELISIFGTWLFCYATYRKLPEMTRVGLSIFIIISPAQSLFHILTCVDRYLAVVHAIIYLRLRQAAAVRIRNIIIGCVWLLCTVSQGLTMLLDYFMISNILFLVFSSIIITFCSLFVLCVLLHPRPGQAGRNRERVDRSKQRAYYTIMAIMGARFPRFLTILVFNTVMALSSYSCTDYCLAMLVVPWFSLPSSLVLPLVFLQRAGKHGQFDN